MPAHRAFLRQRLRLRTRLREVLDVSSLPGCSLGVDAAQVEGTLLGSDSGYANGGDDNYMIDEAITPGRSF